MNYFPVNIFKILCAGWRRRYVIFIPILLLPVFGGVIGVTSQKQYVAHTSMLMQETAKMNPFLEDLAVSSMLKERGEALKILLHSRHILGAVAAELNLFDAASPDYLRDRAISRLSSGLKMQIVGKDLIRIEFRSDKPEGMQKTLQVVSKHFIEQLLAPERSSISDSTRFLQEHLDAKQSELSDAESALADFKSRFSNSLPELHTMNMDRLNKMKQQLAEKESELAGVTRSVGGFDQLLSSTNPIIGRIEENIVSTRAELALARARYTDKHSKVVGLLRNLQRLEKERSAAIKSSDDAVNSDQLWDMASNYSENANQGQPLLISQLQNLQNAKNRVQILKEEISQLSGAIKETESNLTLFSQNENEMYKLQRDLRVKRDLYENLLERREMAEVMGSLGRFEQENRIKVIDRPYTPSRPSNLPPVVLVIIGLIGGVFLGIGLATVLELTDSSIRYRGQLEKLTGLPVIGRIAPMTGTSEMIASVNI